MKTNQLIRKRKYSHLLKGLSRGKRALCVQLAGVLVLLAGTAVCQDNAGAKRSMSMSLTCKVSDGARSLKVEGSKKENGKRLAVDDLKTPISLYLGKEEPYDPATGIGLLGTVCLDDQGVGTLQLPKSVSAFISAHHEGKFMAKFTNDPVYADGEEETTVADAKIMLDYSATDSTKTATATLMGWKDSAYFPVKDAELKLAIKRSFSSLPFSDDGATTDSTGKISANLPLTIPGNPGGTITIAGSITDNDTYGSVETTKAVPWSVVPKIMANQERTLWSNQRNAPIPLVIISCVIIAGIWGTMIMLVGWLFRIRKIGRTEVEIKNNPSHANS